MKKIVLLLSLCFIAIDGFSQVGINTTLPNAQLDIKSSNQVTPSNTDGILIPKIDAFPITNPTAAQQGMMVYLTTLSVGKPPGFYYWDNTGTPQWKGIGGSSGWGLTGNAGTNPATNFIGTTDPTDVVFKRDNVISGKIGMANTSFGRSSLNPASSGIYNSAYGLNSMSSNTSGNSNSAFGNFALTTNTSGNSNTGFGSNVLYSNSTGQNNTAVGSSAMERNSLGSNNTSLGFYSIYNNTLGNNNLALGYESLFLNSLGNNNTAIGYQSGNTLTTGSNNLTLGANANVPSVTGSNQMSIDNVIYGTDMNSSSAARIGINEPSPNAKLQINASDQANPTSTDGIIIPKIDTFPLTNPTAAQNSMMVYLTNDLPGKPKGFYYWDNATTTWKDFGGTGTTDHDFYEVGTTTPPDAITDNMFHTGNVGIGNNNPTYKLDVDETASGKIYALRVRHSNPVDGGISSGIQSTISGASISGVIQGYSTVITPGATSAATGLRNLMGGTSNLDVSGVVNTISSGGSGARTGLNSSFTGTGTGVSYGIFNSFSNPNAITLGVKSIFAAAGIRNKTGVDNEISNSTGGFHTGISTTFTNNNGAIEETGVYSKFTGSSVGNIRGIYNEITNSGSGNVHYGLYNNINGTGGLRRYGVENILSGTSTSEEYGVDNDISTSGGNRTHYGVRNYLSGTGTGSRIGTDNWISGSGSGDQYGVNNYIDNSGTGTKYGIYNYIPPATNGLHYGIYSNATKANSYAGYFLGRMAIGTTVANNYILPLTRGTVNQMMQTDAVGNVTWQDPNTALNSFAWTTTGNSGTNAATNFIGTTDNVDLIFKRGGVKAGLLGSYIAGYGNFSLNANTTGTGNAAFGAYSLRANTTGDGNVAIGTDSMSRIVQGSRGTTIGNAAMFYFSGPVGPFTNTNVAIGAGAMLGEHFGSLPGSNNIGLDNTVIGYRALESISSGNDNTALGYNTMNLNTAGNNNTVFGSQTLFSNISGNSNIAIGFQAAYNETGSNKLYIENSNSATPLIYGEFDNDLLKIHGNIKVDNIATVGNEMQLVNKNNFLHGAGNQIFGNGGDDFILSSEESANETAGVYGDGNAITIWSAGDANGGQSPALVYFLDEDAFDASNTNPYDTASLFPNPVALKSYITPVGAYFQVSDKNKKENIAKIENATEKINQISGYTYQFKLAPEEIKKGDKPIQSSGVLAQEVEKILPQAIQKNEFGDYFVDYAAITPLLIEAIKEQNTKIQSLEVRLEQLEKKLSK